MKNLYEADNASDPTFNITDQEFRTLFLNFCTFVCIIHNKKLNLANIFLFLLKEPKALTLYKSMCDFDTNFDAIKSFLEYDTSLHKSKYIKKYLNSEAKRVARKRGKRNNKSRKGGIQCILANE